MLGWTLVQWIIFIRRVILSAIENRQGLKIACLEKFHSTIIGLTKNILNSIKFYEIVNIRNVAKLILNENFKANLRIYWF